MNHTVSFCWRKRILHLASPAIVMAAVVLLLSACRQESKTDILSPDSPQLKKMEETVAAISSESGDVLTIETLKAALPEKIGSMKRVTHHAQKSSIAIAEMSTAQAEYKDGDKEMAIHIMDGGEVGKAVTSLASWAHLEVDNQDENGYEKTLLIDGRKAWEKYTHKSKSGQLAVIIADRMLITISGKGIEPGDLRKGLSKIHFEK